VKIPAADLTQILGETLGDVAAILERVGARFALVGGLAVSVHTEARATKDIDLAVATDPAGIQRLLDEMAAAGFTPRVHGAPGPGSIVRFSRIGTDGIARWVDVICAGTPFEERAIGRARPATILGREIPIVTVEDLLVYKLLAGRPQDVADAIRLVQDRGEVTG
jgi:hypothetical protein